MSTNHSNLIPMRSLIPGKDTPNRRELLWIAEKKVCHWCGKPTRLCDGDAGDQATIEHIIPRYKGGTNDPENLTSACRSCNGRRSYEDARGMKEGALLGKWPLNKSSRNALSQIALTGDEKKVIIHGGKKSAAEIHLEQRDQALKEIGELRKELKHCEATVKAQEGELKLFHKIVENQESELNALTVWKFVRKRVSEWIRP